MIFVFRFFHINVFSITPDSSQIVKQAIVFVKYMNDDIDDDIDIDRKGNAGYG